LSDISPSLWITFITSGIVIYSSSIEVINGVYYLSLDVARIISPF